jgi:hypothetical protein
VHCRHPPANFSSCTAWKLADRFAHQTNQQSLCSDPTATITKSARTEEVSGRQARHRRKLEYKEQCKRSRHQAQFSGKNRFEFAPKIGSKNYFLFACVKRSALASIPLVYSLRRPCSLIVFYTYTCRAIGGPVSTGSKIDAKFRESTCACCSAHRAG